MASFTNMATLSYNGSQINSNVVTGELRDALTITKTAVSGGYRPGDTVTYVVTLSNTGTAALTGLTLTDGPGGRGAAAPVVGQSQPPQGPRDRVSPGRCAGQRPRL